MASNVAAAAPTQQSKAEMAFLDLAKSKVILFAAKSCELVIFFGCLWITLSMTTPEALKWFDGNVNKFFITAMGFAVDAALPESWVHACVQFIEKKTIQFRWSMVMALAMLVLVAVNAVSVALESSGKVDIPAGLITALLIARLLIGICYVTVRECQGAIDRRSATPPAPAALDIQQMIAAAISELQTRFEGSLAQLAGDQARMLASIQQVQLASATVPQVDTQAIIAGVVAQFETRFTSAMKRLEGEVKQQVLVSQATETGQVKRPGETAITGPRLVSLPQRSVSSGRVKPSQVEQKAAQAGQGETSESADCKSAVYALLDQDNTRQPADLARETGFPRTTVWRHWNRYHEEHGTRGLAGIVAGEGETVAQVETA